MFRSGWPCANASFEALELPFVTDPPGAALAVSLLVPYVVDAPVFDPFEDGFQKDVLFPAVVVPDAPPLSVWLERAVLDQPFVVVDPVKLALRFPLEAL